MYSAFMFFVLASVPVLPTIASEANSKSPSPNACVIPEHPQNGKHVIIEPKAAQPGQTVEYAVLNYTCQADYQIVGRNQVLCVSGTWSDTLPKCVRFCKLETIPSIDYRCMSSDGEGLTACSENVPSGATVQPDCRRPNYLSNEPLKPMKCVDGTWNYIPQCSAECGRVTPEATLLTVQQTPTRNRLPWLAGIYSKKTKPYMQICGGTLVSRSVVISAAHCFWTMESLAPKEEYAVALGKVYRPWNSTHENVVHQSDIKDIHIPPRFLGRATNYAEDIALLVMVQPVVYNTNIRPICLNFDLNSEKQQLRGGNLGKISGWNYIPGTGVEPIVNTIEVPYIETSTCIAQLPVSFREFLTSDKFCVGSPATGPTLCKGLSGGGLAFPEVDKGVQRYYMSGVMSTAQTTEAECQHSIVLFTSISAHEHFIKQFLDTDV